MAGTLGKDSVDIKVELLVRDSLEGPLEGGCAPAETRRRDIRVVLNAVPTRVNIANIIGVGSVAACLVGIGDEVDIEAGSNAECIATYPVTNRIGSDDLNACLARCRGDRITYTGKTNHVQARPALNEKSPVVILKTVLQVRCEANGVTHDLVEGRRGVQKHDPSPVVGYHVAPHRPNNVVTGPTAKHDSKSVAKSRCARRIRADVVALNGVSSGIHTAVIDSALRAAANDIRSTFGRATDGVSSSIEQGDRLLAGREADRVISARTDVISSDDAVDQIVDHDIPIGVRRDDISFACVAAADGISGANMPP